MHSPETSDPVATIQMVLDEYLDISGQWQYFLVGMKSVTAGGLESEIRVLWEAIQGYFAFYAARDLYMISLEAENLANDLRGCIEQRLWSIFYGRGVDYDRLNRNPIMKGLITHWVSVGGLVAEVILADPFATFQSQRDSR